MPNYSYTSTRFNARQVTGTVSEGKVKAGTRKGESFSANDREVIENRKNGVLTSVSVLSGGVTVARLSPDARIW